MEDITDADCMHAKRICKGFETKDLGEYHDLYLKSNTLLLADVFENFRKRCLEIYQLDHPNILTVPGLALEDTFKKIKVKLELLTDMIFYLWLNKELEVKYVTVLIDMKNLIINI